MASSQWPWTSVQQYAEWERNSDHRMEYYDGVVYNMAGATFAHVRIQGNLLLSAGEQLRGTACMPLGSDLKISIPQTSTYVYADLSIFFGEMQEDPTLAESFLNPRVIFEVLSPSTERWDRGGKFGHYKRLPSLTDFVLVSQDAIDVAWWTRCADGEWRCTALQGSDSILEIPSVGLRMSLSAIYDRAFRQQA